MHYNFNKDFVHHQKSSVAEVLKEVVFGMEDGMVSTLGSITGIAVGSGNHFTIILAGVVIIAVESISMGIGSYLSNRSQEELEERKIQEEAHEIANYPQQEKKELYEMYIGEGWPEDLAKQMTEVASQNPKIILKEMSVRELKIVPNQKSVSIKGGLYMFLAYIIGGAVPLFAYFILQINLAIPVSIAVTLVGLVALGMGTTKFTKQPLLRSGLRMMIMGGIALGAGLIAGLLVKQ